MKELIFLKLGGSIITDKNQTNTPQLETLKRLCSEISHAITEKPDLSLLVGHGSGSFGHVAASKYQTREGVQSSEQWFGYAKVANRARALNQIVIDSFLEANIPAVSFSACSAISTDRHVIQNWDITPIQSALVKNLVPVIYGDVVFDQTIGGTILSTEDLFDYLAQYLHPDKILLAGLENGVWIDFPKCTQLHHEITPKSNKILDKNITKSASTDVTGGMRSKVDKMLNLVCKYPNTEVTIFSARQSGNVYSSLMGKQIGTVIRNPGRRTP